MTCHTCHPATSAKQITQLFINRKLILTLLKGDYQLIFSRMKVIRNTWQTWQRGKFLPLTHSVAKANAIRCDGKVNAFRWPMQYIDFTDALRQESVLILFRVPIADYFLNRF